MIPTCIQEVYIMVSMVTVAIHYWWSSTSTYTPIKDIGVTWVSSITGIAFLHVREKDLISAVDWGSWAQRRYDTGTSISVIIITYHSRVVIIVESANMLGIENSAFKKLYRIAGNFRGVKYSLFSWAGWPPRNFIVGVAYLNVGMPCSHETKRNFYSRKLPFLEFNEFFTPRNLPAIR